MSFNPPREIARFIGDAVPASDTVGESPCSVHHFTRRGDTFYVKHAPAFYARTTYSVLREARVLDWLAGRLNVPEVVCVTAGAGGEWMITRAVPGEPLAARIDAGQPVVGLFREALRQVRAVPVAGCPFESGIGTRLDELAYLLAYGRVAHDHDPGRWPGLATPRDLFAHLHASAPREEPVFSHGDLCDGNVFVDARDNLHFIDLGRGGVADRWLDVAFVYRELRERVSTEAAQAFIDGLEERDRPEKRLFFEQLDELF